MSTTTIDVAGYAAAVRAALTGLGPEQVEDLTDGLEANLADALADEGRGIVGQGAEQVFGPADDYAHELLAAAGLTGVGPVHPPRRSASELASAPFRALLRRGRQGLAALRARPGWSAIEEFLLALRPAWWVLRAWVLWAVLVATVMRGGRSLLLRPSAVQLLVLGVLLVVSVQWGRGRWRTRGAWHVLALAVSTVAVLATVPALVHASTPQVRTNWVEVPAAVSDGVVVDGVAATNLFVYDGAGNPVAQAQVYDQDGRPVRTLSHDYGGYSSGGQWWAFAAATSGTEPRWNVFPLLSAPMSQWTTGVDGVDRLLPGAQLAASWPFAKAPAVTAAAASSTSAASAEPEEPTQPTSSAVADPGVSAVSTDGADPSAPAAAEPSAAPAG